MYFRPFVGPLHRKSIYFSGSPPENQYQIFTATTRVVVFWPMDFSDHFEAIKKMLLSMVHQKHRQNTTFWNVDEFVTFFQKKRVVYSRMNCLLNCFQMSKTINTMRICTIDFKNAPIQQHASFKKQFWSGFRKKQPLEVKKTPADYLSNSFWVGPIPSMEIWTNSAFQS